MNGRRVASGIRTLFANGEQDTLDVVTPGKHYSNPLITKQISQTGPFKARAYVMRISKTWDTSTVGGLHPCEDNNMMFDGDEKA